MLTPIRAAHCVSAADANQGAFGTRPDTVSCAPDLRRRPETPILKSMRLNPMRLNPMRFNLKQFGSVHFNSLRFKSLRFNSRRRLTCDLPLVLAFAMLHSGCTTTPEQRGREKQVALESDEKSRSRNSSSRRFFKSDSRSFDPWTAPRCRHWPKPQNRLPSSASWSN